MSLFQMSVAGGVLILFIVVIRALAIHRLPKTTFLALWMIAALRLLLPFSIPLPFNIHIGLDVFSDVVQELPSGNIASTLPGDSPPSYDIGTAVPSPATEHISTFEILWLVGVLLLAIYFSISYFRSMRKFRMSIPDNTPYIQNWLTAHQISRPLAVRSSDLISSPLTYGILHPVILLPKKLDRNDQVALKYVLTHEYVHIRRFDAITKILFAAVLCIHWFNPLMWLAYVLLCRDIELACDEKVIKELDNEQRADYAQALVVCSVNRRMIAACPLAFGEVGVKDRVKSVMNYKKPAFWIIILAVIACVIVAVCFLTNPMGFQFDEATHTIVSANHFDMRNADDAVAIEMNPAQISELSSRLAGVKNTKKSDEYGGFTPGYQISALLEDGTYIRINGYSLSDNDMVDIEWNEERYVVSDEEFQDYLSRICAGGDVSSADNAVAGKTYLYEGEGFMGNFTITLYNDGTFTYYEGMASSYIGIGAWEQNGDSIILTDDGHGGYGLVNHFRCDGNDLVFVEQDSNNFVYVKVKDGERFHSTGEAFKPNDTTAAVTKWFDYLETPDEMKWDGSLEINLTEFPDVTFRWSYGEMLAVKGSKSTSLYTGMPIWNTYFCDLSGDGLPELCSTISWGSGMIDNRVIIYDYANGASYELSDRGNFDFTLRFNEADGYLYVDKRKYNTDELVQSGRLVFKDDCLQVEGFSSNVDEPAKYYLTIGAEGVKSIELTMPNSSGGCENADGSLFKKGERIWLENLDGYTDLRGLTITALGENGEIIWTASIPNEDENQGFTHLVNDDWEITNIE